MFMVALYPPYQTIFYKAHFHHSGLFQMQNKDLCSSTSVPNLDMKQSKDHESWWYWYYYLLSQMKTVSTIKMFLWGQSLVCCQGQLLWAGQSQVFQLRLNNNNQNTRPGRQGRADTKHFVLIIFLSYSDHATTLVWRRVGDAILVWDRFPDRSLWTVASPRLRCRRWNIFNESEELSRVLRLVSTTSE